MIIQAEVGKIPYKQGMSRVDGHHQKLGKARESLRGKHVRE